MILNNAFEEIRPCFPFKNWYVFKPVPAINSASRYSDKLMLLYPIGGSWRRRLTLKYSKGENLTLVKAFYKLLSIKIQLRPVYNR